MLRNVPHSCTTKSLGLSLASAVEIGYDAAKISRMPMPRTRRRPPQDRPRSVSIDQCHQIVSRMQKFVVSLSLAERRC